MGIFLLTEFCFSVVKDKHVISFSTQVKSRHVLHLTSDPSVLFFKFKESLNGPILYQHDLDRLTSSLEFDHSFSRTSRFTAFYGCVGYKYGSTEHIARPVNTNPVIYELYKLICGLYPNLEFINSILVNYYPGNSSYLPFHADDEDEIHPESFIFTLSLGSSRQMGFRFAGSRRALCWATLNHGDLIAFSRKSQDVFEHCIRSAVAGSQIGVRDTDTDGDTAAVLFNYRVSLTFRLMDRRV